VTDRLLTAEEPTYLGPDELFELTRRRQRPAQIAWLREHHWRFVADADGNPRVARAYWRRRMVDDRTPDLEIIGPKFETLPALRKRA